MPLIAYPLAHEKDNGNGLLIGGDHRNSRCFPTFAEGGHCVSMVELLLSSGLTPSVIRNALHDVLDFLEQDRW